MLVKYEYKNVHFLPFSSRRGVFEPITLPPSPHTHTTTTTSVYKSIFTTSNPDIKLYNVITHMLYAARNYFRSMFLCWSIVKWLNEVRAYTNCIHKLVDSMIRTNRSANRRNSVSINSISCIGKRHTMYTFGPTMDPVCRFSAMDFLTKYILGKETIS